MEIRHIFIQGAGMMGNGIAQVCARAGYEMERDREEFNEDYGSF